MGGNETKKLVKGALILTLAGLVSKILSAGYRIPLQNLTGDVGFYIYQQVYPLLAIATALALYGFPSAISKLTADMRKEEKRISFQHFYGPIFLILLSICSIIFVFLYLNADALAVWVGDNKLFSTYKLAAFAFLLIPFTSLLRGVFQGFHYMKPTAYSQIGEQIIRVFIIIVASYLIATGGLSIYKVGRAAGIASIAGSLTALVILAIYFIKVRPKERGQVVISWRYYARTILLFGLLAALNHMILIITQFADTFTLVPSLMEYGVDKLEAMKMKGVFDRGQPLIQVGAVLGSSFALALIPGLSKQEVHAPSTISYAPVQSALKFSFYLAFAAMLGLILIFPEVNTLLFQNNQGTLSLRILSLSVLLSSLAITSTTILQGMGYLKRTAAFILFAFFIKWISNQILVPFLGITGGALATVLSLFILCGIVFFELKRKVPSISFLKSINWRSFFIAASGMFLYLIFIKRIMPDFIGLSRITLLLWVIFIAVTGAILYIFLLVRFKAFTKKELSMMPFAKLFIHLSKEEQHD